MGGLDHNTALEEGGAKILRMVESAWEYRVLLKYSSGICAPGAIVVPRDRFAPVKTCADLFVLRSDVFRIAEDSTVQAVTKQVGGSVGYLVSNDR